MKKLLLLLVLLLVPTGNLLMRAFAPAPLPRPDELTAPLPPASPPPGMEVFQLPTGVTHRSAAFAYRGGSFFDKRDFAMTAVLVRHPRGDLLIDTGFGENIDTQIRILPLPFRLLTSYDRTTSAAGLLQASGYDRTRLSGILLTHAHWDHVSGVPDFPGTPVWVTEAERQSIVDGGMVTALARSFTGVTYQEYAFEGGPYLGFPTSHDVHGDGSIVVVPAPGHTPGSVVVFLALPGGRRYALVGDLVWQLEGILEREERAWPLRRIADHEPAGVRENILRMAAIAARYPDITIAPAHDSRGCSSMPTLPRNPAPPRGEP